MEVLTKDEKAITAQSFESNKVERQSGLELLRIFAMLFIIIHHIIYHFDFEFSYPLKYVANILSGWGKLGSNIFVFISAYFLVDKKFKLSRVLNIIIQALFYSIVIYLIFLIAGGESFNSTSFFNNIFPIYTGKWWFITVYIIFLFLLPIFNSFIHNISRNLHNTICFVLIFLFSVMPLVSFLFTGKYRINLYLNDVFWFITLYFIVSYIKFYNIKIQKKFLILALILFWAVQNALGMIFNFTTKYMYSFENMILTIILFLLFKDLKFKSKFVNTVASTTFGIYLIHDNDYIEGLWQYIVPYFNGFLGSYILAFLLLTPIVFVVCSLIDLIRLKTIHKLTTKLLNKIDKKIEDKFNFSNNSTKLDCEQKSSENLK